METKPEGNPDAAADPQGLANQELVRIFDTQRESEAMVVQGLLESAGIESMLSSLDAPQDILPGVGGVVLRVMAGKAEEARRVIEEFRSAAEASDPDLNDDSAA